MGRELAIVTPLHRRTARDYLGRMMDDKVHCMEVARQYGRDYWDGDRRYGYGGYTYDGRWAPVAKRLIAQYDLPQDARVLDVGCGKAHLLHEFTTLLPHARVAGIDLSTYALEHAVPDVRPFLSAHRAEEPYPFEDGAFDLVVSITTLHNLDVCGLERALAEITRVGRRAFVVVESYRTPAELFALQCWALTCESFHSPAAWVRLFERFGYSGDYEFVYFE